MENKYYIDENGLITVIQSISNSIIEHTSGEITFTEQEDPQTGEVEKIIDKPNNFPTVKAVTDYLKNRNNLKFVYESNTPTSSDRYDTITHEKQYNGEKEVRIDMKLATSEDIKQLFRQ